MKRLEEEEDPSSSEHDNSMNAKNKINSSNNMNNNNHSHSSIFNNTTATANNVLKLNRVASCRQSPRRRTSVVLERRRGGSFRAPPRTKVVELDFRSTINRLNSNSCKEGSKGYSGSNNSAVNSPQLPAAVTIEGASPEEDDDDYDDVFTTKLKAFDLNKKRYRKNKAMNGQELYDDSSPDSQDISPWESNMNQEVFKYDLQKRRPSAFADQFDEFVYKSQHMAHSSEMEMENPTGYFPQTEPNSGIPPEVNIEIPSDSDSSRRASKASYGMRLSNASSMNNMVISNHSPIRTPVGASPSAPPNSIVHKPRKLSSSSPSSKSPPMNNLLNARQSVDRRSSHTGILTRNSPSSSSVHYPRRSVMNSAMPNTLIVPKRRSRGSSLPGNIILDQEDIYRLRNFSMSGKKVINRGDSLKTTKSNHSINSSGSSVELRGSSHRSSSVSADDFSSAASSRRPSKGSRRSSQRYTGYGAEGSSSAQQTHPPQTTQEPSPPEMSKMAVYKVAMLGASGVGKSALTSQFLSSDDINTYDTVEDDVQKTVSLSVDGNESKLVFIDHSSTDMSVENQVSTYEPDGYIVVYAVDESESLKRAELILQYLKTVAIIEQHAVILVANKTDLVRSRVVSTNSGKAVAIRYGCKYIETSPGINHNVDELLVGMLTQIQLRIHHQANTKEQKHSGGFKILDLMEKVWKLQNNKSKSCGNLQIL